MPLTRPPLPAARRRAARPADDAGVVAVVVAILFSVVLLTVGAMAVDLGSAFSRQRSLQRAADLAALAGAQHLPDVAAARDAAIQSLCNPDNSVLGWTIGVGSPCVSNTAWASSANPTAPDESNGEIEFYAGVPDENTGLYAPSQRINSGEARAIRVVTPPATVDFNLARGVPGLPTSVVAQKAATAIAGTPMGGGGEGGAIPFFLFLDDGVGGSSAFCIKDAGPFGGGPTLGCPTTGSNRGFIDEPRSDVNGANNQMQSNVKFGYDHPIHAYPLWPCGGTTPPQTSLSGPCPTNTVLPGSAVGSTRLCSRPPLAAGTFYPYPGLGAAHDVNCLRLSDGNRTGPLKSGLLSDSDARLRGNCTGVAGSAGHGVGGTIDQNKLFTAGSLSLDTSLLNPDLTAGQRSTAAAALLAGSPNPVNAPLFSQAIFRCPRLALMPRLQLMAAALPTGGNAATTTFPINSFSYVWIGGDDSDNGLIWGSGNALRGVKAYVIDDTYLPGTSDSADGDLTGPVVGSGRPLVVNLIHDAWDLPS